MLYAINRCNYVRGNFTEGKNLLMQRLVDVVLVPVVVTTTDVQDFDFSIPILKSW